MTPEKRRYLFSKPYEFERVSYLDPDWDEIPNSYEPTAEHLDHTRHNYRVNEPTA